MRFRFCGDADCPDWVLAEINTLSRLSSVKLKLLGQMAVKGIVHPPFDVEKLNKLFIDSKLDSDIDLKACIACLTYIISSATRFNCDSSALQSELQQLGLPREHSTSIKRVFEDQNANLAETFKTQSLKVNALEQFAANADMDLNCVKVDLTNAGNTRTIALAPGTVDALLADLKSVRKTMADLNDYM
ncbi:COMM domain-containing protein 4 [Cylas formicarius]|uniref:COMM domain-containing protein 4 n=1 Tax=Cylas formicarius TaxID=197179 RepID=UPI0029587D75|nr:COMM domain-containing protein 4 [Cylas formicarius]